MGLDGVPIERLAPSESFGRYIDHLGTALTRNEWRIGQEQQWINTVQKVDAGIRIEGFNGTMLPATPEGKALEKLREVWAYRSRTLSLHCGLSTLTQFQQC
jgi:hypothetical protein